MLKKSFGRRSITATVFFLFCLANACAADGTFLASRSVNGRVPGIFQSLSGPSVTGIEAVSPDPARPIGSSLSVSCLERLNHDIPGSLRLTEDADVAKPRSPKKKVGRIMTFAGLGAALLGGIMVAAAPEKPNDIADSGVGINWRATGFAWIGVGLGVAIAGLILGSSK
jgi:hypothetical protein